MSVDSDIILDMLDKKESQLRNILTGMRTKTKNKGDARGLFDDLR